MSETSQHDEHAGEQQPPLPVFEHIEAAQPSQHSDPRVRAPFPAGNHLVSVQASALHFCTPKVTSSRPISEYATVELAVWHVTHAHGHYCTPTSCPDLAPFAHLYPSPRHSYASYVPWPIVQQIADHLSQTGTFESPSPVTTTCASPRTNTNTARLRPSRPHSSPLTRVLVPTPYPPLANDKWPSHRTLTKRETHQARSRT